jgi:hypothetical protein
MNDQLKPSAAPNEPISGDQADDSGIKAILICGALRRQHDEFMLATNQRDRDAAEMRLVEHLARHVGDLPFHVTSLDAEARDTIRIAAGFASRKWRQLKKFDEWIGAAIFALRFGEIFGRRDGIIATLKKDLRWRGDPDQRIEAAMKLSFALKLPNADFHHYLGQIFKESLADATPEIREQAVKYAVEFDEQVPVLAQVARDFFRKELAAGPSARPAQPTL